MVGSVEKCVDWDAFLVDVKALMAEAIEVAKTMEDENTEERGSLAHEAASLLEKAPSIVEQVSQSILRCRQRLTLDLPIVTDWGGWVAGLCVRDDAGEA